VVSPGESGNNEPELTFITLQSVGTCSKDESSSTDLRLRSMGAGVELMIDMFSEGGEVERLEILGIHICTSN
jgi:hypothetical protein